MTVNLASPGDMGLLVLPVWLVCPAALKTQIKTNEHFIDRLEFKTVEYG